MTSTINANTSGGLISTGDTSGVLALQTGGTTAVTIDASQNVGIGTSSPATKLQVVGTIAVGDGTNGQIRLTSNSTINYFDSLNNAASAWQPTVARATTFDWYSSASGTPSTGMKLDSSGNLGLGVTPSAWGSIGAFQLKANAALFAAGNSTYLAQNHVYDGSTSKYIASGYALQYEQNKYLGQHIWYNAPSGTAGAAATFTQAMTLDASGNLLVGTTLQNGAKLNVFGGDIIPATSGSTQNGGFRVSSKTTGGGGYVLDMGVSDTNAYAWMQVSNSQNLANGFTKDLVLQPIGNNVLVGGTTANTRLGQKLQSIATSNYGGAALTSWTGAQVYYAPLLDFNKSRGSSEGSYTTVANGDCLGILNFRGADGSAFQDSAAISAYVDGTVGAGAMPGRIIFQTAPAGSTSLAERMRIDSSGNVGINNTSPSTFGKFVMQVQGTTTPTNATNVGPSSINLYPAGNAGSTNCTTGIFGWLDPTPGIGAGIGFSRENSVDWGSQIRFYTHPTTTSNIGDITERARIDSSGALLINATSKVSGTTYLSVQGSTAASNIMEQKDTGTSYASGNYYQVYFNSSNSVAGGVAHTAATTVAFNTSSDVRLKENIVDAPSVLDKVLAAQVRSFDWKEDGHHVDYGFIAQELYQQLPEAVGKGDDETELTDAKGTWQVEYGRLTPMLVKAIQEQQTIIQTLTSRIEALENK